METFAPKLCEQHKNEQLKLYCTVCAHFVCTSCFMEKHQGHIFKDAKVAADDYRSKLRDSIDEISTCANQIQPKHSQLEQRKSVIATHMRSLKDEIEKRRVQIRGIVDIHAYSLMAELSSLDEEKLKDIETKRENINRHSVCLENYKSYTSELAEKATNTDIYEAFESVTARALELKEMSAKITQQYDPVAQAAFWKTNLDEFISHDAINIVGTIQGKFMAPYLWFGAWSQNDVWSGNSTCT